MNIALLSPSKDSYSETFIRAQKENLNGRIFYYYGGNMPTKLEHKGFIITLWLKLIKKAGLFKESLQQRALMNSFEKNKIDIVLAHYGATGEAVAAVCEKMNLPLVVHFHGYDASMKKVINKYNSYYKSFRVAKYVVAVSKEMMETLLKLGCPKDKLIYNPCAPNDIFYKVTPDFLKPQFLAVGRFTEKKGPEFTIKAFNTVLNDFPRATLLMAGEGELLETCKVLVDSLGIKRQVQFLGIIKQEELLMHLEVSLAFIQHSITAKSGDKEGTPVAILEASAAGLPIISTIHAGIPDVIINNETGLLVEERDVNAMSNKMLELLENPTLAKKMGTKGKQHIKNNFNLERHINVLNEVIKMTL